MTNAGQISSSRDVVERVRFRLDQGDVSARAGFLMGLVVDEALVSQGCLKALKTGRATVCGFNGQVLLNIELPSGWIDRRILGARASNFLKLAGSCHLSGEDFSEVGEWLEPIYPQVLSKDRFASLVRNAIEHWSCRLPGPLMGHVLRYAPFQLLPLHAWWRLATRGYSSPNVPDSATVENDLIDGVLTEQHSCETRSIDLLLDLMRSAVRAKGSRASGRLNIQEAIVSVMPTAKEEGAAQVLTLYCFAEVVAYGGLRGTLLAPASLLQYAALTLKNFCSILIKLGSEDEASEYSRSYAEILQRIEESQKPKAASMLQALHDRLTLRGAPVLSFDIQGKAPIRPPCAVTAWPHEIELSLEYINKAGGDPRVQRQAELLVRLGSAIPFRTSEYFQLRLVDICPGGSPFLVNYPRSRDGSHKSRNTRMQHDIENDVLLQKLLDYRQLRAEEEFLPETVNNLDLYFFGIPGYESAYAVQETMALVHAALRWATGDPRASVYDLRHSAIGGRANVALASTEISDVDSWTRFSRGCGHGNPDSSRSYIHQIENVLFEFLHGDQVATSDCMPVVSVCEMFLAEERPPIAYTAPLTKSSADQLNLEQFHLLLSGLAQDYPLNYLNARFNLQSSCIPAVLSALRWSCFDRATAIGGTDREICLAFTNFSPASIHANQPKFRLVKKKLFGWSESRSWSELRLFARTFRSVQVNDQIDLSAGTMSEFVVEFLRGCGLSRNQLVATADVDRLDLKRKWTKEVGAVRNQTRRKSRPPARLFIVDAGVQPETARGATLSVSGLFWWVSVVELFLILTEGVQK
jgi:hypothetical protein